VRMIVLGTLHIGLLTSCRWAFWGSLFDGTEKFANEAARRAT
jgi:hypothetical protein